MHYSSNRFHIMTILGIKCIIEFLLQLQHNYNTLNGTCTYVCTYIYYIFELTKLKTQAVDFVFKPLANNCTPIACFMHVS